jgi:energy-coupling factor transport system ATP-binding protein
MRKMKKDNLKIIIKKACYEENDQPLLSDLAVALDKGEILTLYGKTGSGKTSFLKCAAGIIPNVQPSVFDGEIQFNNATIPFEELKNNIGMTFQETESQFIFDTVNHEINMHLTTKERKKAGELCSYFGIKHLVNCSLKNISAGQKKLVSLISVLASSREIILLDEPTANLDDNNRKKLLKLLYQKIKKDKIIIISTHDLKIADISDKFLLHEEMHKKWVLLENKNQFLQRISLEPKIELGQIKKIRAGSKIITLENVSYTYPDYSHSLKDVTFSIKKGEIVGLIGDNGAGKTTLINLITGKLKPKKGKIIRDYKRIALILQEPEKQIFSNTVLGELTFGIKNPLKSKKEIRHMLEIIGLEKEKDNHPFFLSRGQKQQLLIASVLIKMPEIIIIDEPFTGLDNKSIKKIINLLLNYYHKYNPTIILLDQQDAILEKIINKKLVVSGQKVKMLSV